MAPENMSTAIEDKTQNARPMLSNTAAAAAYVVILLAALAAFFWVRSIGEAQMATAAGAVAEASPQTATRPVQHGTNVILHVLITLSSVILVGYSLGRLFRFIGQPPVIGEVVAGIVLGPSLFGWLAPDLMHLLIPAVESDPRMHVTAALQTIAQLGVLLYMFVVGLELNAATLKHRMQAAVAISHMSIVLPFMMGVVLALWLHTNYCPTGVNFTSFSLFVGVAMAITAFPVLARILTDRGLSQTRLGSLALASAAADDVTAWCLLALVVGIVQSRVETALGVFVGSLVYVCVMFFVVRPLVRSWCVRMDRQAGDLPPAAMVLGLAAVLVSGLTTELIGIHAIFGGFLMGAIIPHDSRLAAAMKARLNDLVTILLLPAFFAYTGMRTEIGLISGWENWLFCVIIILVATAGKFGGTLIAARATGSSWNEASALGILMNTRGLMELIVLNIGLDLGVITNTLFAMMVLMALVTTMATSPILALLNRKS